MARAGVDRNVVLIVAVVVDDAGHGRPRVLDVVEVPPEVAGRDDGRPVGLQRGTPRGKAGQQKEKSVQDNRIVSSQENNKKYSLERSLAEHTNSHAGRQLVIGPRARVDHGAAGHVEQMAELWVAYEDKLPLIIGKIKELGNVMVVYSTCHK